MTKQNIISNSRLYLDDQKLEYKYLTDLTTGFHYFELKANTYENSRVLEQNAILFIIDGSCSFSYNQYKNRVFLAGEMIFLPKSAIITGLVLEDSNLLYMTYDIPISIYDRLFITSLNKKKRL